VGGDIDGVMSFVPLICNLQVPDRVFGKGGFFGGGGAL